MKHRKLYPLMIAIVMVLFNLVGQSSPLFAQENDSEAPEEPPAPTLLTDPFLQLPTADGVHVVWFTEWPGDSHTVTYGADLEMTAEAETIKLSRTAEDQNSFVGEQTKDNPVYEGVTGRDIWRHEALVEGLTAGERVPYFVTSVTAQGEVVESDQFTLQPLPTKGQPLKILLTSDHQLKPMTPANLEMVERTVGQVDAIFFAGDLINIPDRASEWFDDSRGFSFFPNLQGKGNFDLKRTLERNGVTYESTRTYSGGELIQHAPLFPVVGNHEVMGRYNPANDLNTQFNDPHPRAIAEARYQSLAELLDSQDDDPLVEEWLLNNSFNTVTYEEIFTLPEDGPAGEQYYALQFGDVYLIGLYATRIWRTPSLADNARGKYREPLTALNTPDNWGYGEFIFEDLSAGSPQHDWLIEQLNSEAFQQAKYKIVMMHQAAHGLGGNYNPAFVNPVRVIDRDEAGHISMIRYEYPIDQDMIINDVQSLWEEAGVQLVQTGHSHLWFRLEKDGINYMETSNVGNSYGCYLEDYAERRNGPNDDRFEAANYVLVGDPQGLEPIFPTVFAPMQDDEGHDLPCVTSNDLSVFTILDTATGTISSYVYDTRDPESEPQLFDEFTIGE